MTRGLGPAAILAALALAGCGGGRPGLTPSEQTQLLGLIGKARTAAAAGNPDAAQAALGQLRTRITHLRLAGELDAAGAARMQTVAAQAQSAVRAQSPAAAVTPRTPATTVPPARAVPPKVAAPPSVNPTQIVIQGADALRNRVQQSVDQGVARLKDQLARLRSRLPGAGGG